MAAARRFNDLDLSSTSKRAITALGFDMMTPVQAAVIPLLLNHRDVVAEACTGSGKVVNFLFIELSLPEHSQYIQTLAFVIPMVEMILRRDRPLRSSSVGTIVISPTRELARQTFSVCAHFAANSEDALGHPILITGGDAVSDNLKKINDAKNNNKTAGLSMVICTPGRLDDLLHNYELFDVKELELLVLDEADTLLNLGFRPQLTSILGRLPKQRRTGLFSATQTREVKELARAGLRNPASVSVAVRAQAFSSNTNNSTDEAGHSTVDMVSETYGVQATPASLSNYYLLCDPSNKLLLLMRFLYDHRHEKVMVFFLTCAAVEFWERSLNAIAGDFFENIPTYLDQKTLLSSSSSKTENEIELNSSEKVTALSSSTTTTTSEKEKPILQPDLSHLTAKQRKKHKERARLRQRKLDAEHLANKMKALESPINIMGLHGKMDQKKRCGVFAQFRAARSAAPGELGGGAVLLCTDVAARGLDVPDVDWIVQMDAPQDPAAFVHRVGRAGRAGRKGASLLMLSQQEDTYVEFLALRKVALSPYRIWDDYNAWWNDKVNDGDGKNTSKTLTTDKEEEEEEEMNENEGIQKKKKKQKKEGGDESGTISKEVSGKMLCETFEKKSNLLVDLLRRSTCKDRDILEKGSKAFMAHLRAYKDHKCEFIFRWASLDVGSLANLFGMIRLPKIPELKGKKVFGFTPDFTVKTEEIPYLNKIKEKARQKRLVVMKEASAAALQLEEMKAEQEDLIKHKQLSGAAKKQAKILAEKIKLNPKWTEEGPRKRKGKHELMIDEWEELAKEERLYKKLKKGKISQKQYEKSLKGYDSNEDQDDHDEA